jgi:drug/metabolite transporter (DMT)-like permease
MLTNSEYDQPPTSQLILAFAALYIIWGSTYLAIKIAIETMPPFFMASSRFLIAGALLYGLARFKGANRPNTKQWKHSAIVGTFLIAGGNGVVTVAERWVDSNIAALIIASSPLFMTLLGWLGGVQKKPGWLGIGSLLLGLGGVAYLIESPNTSSESGQLGGYALVLLAVLSWTIGCIFAKRNPIKIDSWLNSSMQMICGSIVCLVTGLCIGEIDTLSIGGISARSWIAFVYLIIFGSIIGYTSYVFLLKHCTPTTVSSHAYVNPVVAVILGWLILDERLTQSGWIGSGLILISVFALLQRQKSLEK